MKLSVIIPAYNEAQRLPATLADAHAWLTGHMPDQFEIIVVDDGSSDDGCERVEQLRMPELRLLRQPQNMGKGAAVRRGMLAANGDIHLFMDADHSTHIREIEKALPLLRPAGDADIVIASRQHPDSDIRQAQSPLREYMGKGFNRLMRMATGIDMADTQCGFKAFTAEASRRIFSRQQLDGFSFDAELLYLAGRMGYRVAEIPVQWINDPNSRVRILIEPLKMFADILKIRRLHRHLSDDA
jgi:glycosyltransferase involved in cell wall biosynthesis